MKKKFMIIRMISICHLISRNYTSCKVWIKSNSRKYRTMQKSRNSMKRSNSRLTIKKMKTCIWGCRI